MHRTEADNKITVGGKNLYSDGPPGTTVEAVDLNAIQEELCNTITGAGLTLETVSTESQVQLLAAINALIAAGAPDAIQDTDFSSKNLIIDVATVTTVDCNADELSLINDSNILAFINDLDTTFDITTDRPEGAGVTNELASTWYQLWIDSNGTRAMVPDLTGTDDGADDNKLIDSGADFVTFKVQVGDIVHNITDGSKASVSAVDNLTTLSLTPITAGFVMQNGDSYMIRGLSPVGLGSFKARVGAAYNDASGNLVNSTYTQIQEPKTYVGDGTDFSVSGQAGFSNSETTAIVTQTKNEFSPPDWTIEIFSNYSQNVATNATITLNGVTFISKTQGGTGRADTAAVVRAAALGGNGVITVSTNINVSGIGLYIKAKCLIKPSFHK